MIHMSISAKESAIKLLTTLLCIISAISATAITKDEKITEFRVEGYITNMITGEPITDNVTVEVLSPDSTVIAQGESFYSENSATGTRNFFNLRVKGVGNSFILRFTLQDFDTVIRPFTLNGAVYETGIVEMRRLSKFEKNMMLGEVTVQASVLQFVNKGDTIQYNADAFKIAQGSMLDALIERMPGVELKDNGQIYVNGRFVEKLLLDGKDFFQGDKLVLLQNLPAYTVQNIQVYEKANNVAEVLGKTVAGRDQYEYVMDVKLKKGYNAGWMANAEIAGGTHSRYRGRAFGLGYTKSMRLAAYGFINNLNETRNPGRNGDWNPSDSRNGLTNAKGGGIDYGFYHGNSFQITGNVAASYKHTDLNTRTSQQNFLTGGDTYTRRWDNSLNRDLQLNTQHILTFRPSQGNKYNTRIELYGDYGDTKKSADATEGSFNSKPDSGQELKENLVAGMPAGTDIINRYLNYLESRQREWGGSWQHNSTFRIKDTPHGITLSSHGFYYRGLTDATNNYTLQYNGEQPQDNRRINPGHNHRYEYWVGTNSSINLSSTVTIMPSIAYCHRYLYNDNTWYVSQTGGNEDWPDASSHDPDFYPTDRVYLIDKLMLLDPRNSYTTGQQHSHEYITMYFKYFKEEKRDGKSYSLLSINLNAGANINHERFKYDGLVSQFIKKNYVSPSSNLSVFWSLPKRIHTLELQYSLNGVSYNMMDLVDVTFDSDPLNLRTGNSGLKQKINSTLKLNYTSSKLWKDRLFVNASINWRHPFNDVAMSYNYDRATGIRTYRPVNVSGNQSIIYHLGWNVFVDPARKFWLYNSSDVTQGRLSDMVSTDGFASITKNIVKTLGVSDEIGLEYDFKGHTVGIKGSVDTEHSSSSAHDFTPFNITTFSYGAKCRFALPYNIEITSDITMYSNRGYDYHEMNTNQLVWNARISKQLLKGRLIVAFDGYDMLGNVKSISYNISSQARTETWVNSIPSYVMLSVKWNFSKKPRE